MNVKFRNIIKLPKAIFQYVIIALMLLFAIFKLAISIAFEQQCQYGYKQVDLDLIKMMLGFSAFDFVVVLVAFLLIERFNNKCIAFSSILLIFFFIPVLFLKIDYNNTKLTFDMCCNSSSTVYIDNNTNSPICHFVDSDQYVCTDFNIFNVTGVQDIDRFSYEYIILLMGIVISFVYYILFTYAIYEEKAGNIKNENRAQKRKITNNNNNNHNNSNSSVSSLLSNNKRTSKNKSTSRIKNPMLRIKVEEDDSPTITPLVTPTGESDEVHMDGIMMTHEERKSIIEDTVKVEKNRSKYLPIIALLFCTGSLAIAIYLFVLKSQTGYNLISTTHCVYNLLVTLLMILIIILYLVFSERIINNFFNFYLCYLYIPMIMCLFAVFAFVIDRIEDYVETYKTCCDVDKLNLVGKCGFLDEEGCSSFDSFTDSAHLIMPLYITFLRIIFLAVPLFLMIYYGVLKRKASMLTVYLTNHRKVFPEIVT